MAFTWTDWINNTAAFAEGLESNFPAKPCGVDLNVELPINSFSTVYTGQQAFVRDPSEFLLLTEPTALAEADQRLAIKTLSQTPTFNSLAADGVRVLPSTFSADIYVRATINAAPTGFRVWYSGADYSGLVVPVQYRTTGNLLSFGSSGVYPAVDLVWGGLIPKGLALADVQKTDLAFGMWVTRSGSVYTAEIIREGAVLHTMSSTGVTGSRLQQASLLVSQYRGLFDDPVAPTVGSLPDGHFLLRESAAYLTGRGGTSVNWIVPNMTVPVGDFEHASYVVPIAGNTLLGEWLGNYTPLTTTPVPVAAVPPPPPAAFWTNFRKTFETP